MRGESMKDKSKKSTYSTTFGVDPESSYNVESSSDFYVGLHFDTPFAGGTKKDALKQTPMVDQ